MLLFTQLIAARLPYECQTPGVVALTFEEGPVEYTEEILNILREYDIKATFNFNAVFRTDKTRMLIQQAYDDGHEVGLRTSPLRDYFLIDDEEGIQDDIQMQINYLEDIIDDQIKYAKSPTRDNEVNEVVYEYLTDNGIVQTGYSFSPYDMGEDPVAALEDHLNTSSSKFDSKIIPLYESKLMADDKLEEIIEIIQKKGFTFVTMSDCLLDYKPGDPIKGVSTSSKPANGVKTFINGSFVTMLVYILM